MAAVRDVKARVSIEGEKEYKQALSDLNQSNRVLGSEMKKLKAEYQGNTDSVEYLTKKGEILDKQLADQRERVEVLRKAVQAAAAANGEADASTLRYTEQLNNAEAQMYDLEHAIQQNNDALNQNAEAVDGENTKMVGLGDTVDGLAGKLGIKLPQGAKDALNGMQGLSAGTVAAMGAAVAAVAALVETVKALHNMTLETAADVDELITESMITGLSTTTIQQLKYAENLIDVSYSTISGSLTKLTNNMQAAKNGNEKTAESFAALGVSIYDSAGQLRNAEDVFYDTIDALGQIENQTERDAATMELFGKSAQELNPIILAGSDALRELADEAEAAGYVLDESQIKKLGEVDDAYQRMQLAVEAAKKEIASEFAPASTEALETFTKLVKGASEACKNSEIVKTLGLIVENLLGILTGSNDLSNGGIPALEAAFAGLNTALGAVALTLAAIRDALEFITSLGTLNFSGAAHALGFGYGSGNANNFQRTMMSLDGRLEQYDEFYGRNASGDSNWRGGLTWVGEAGPELVSLPRGSQIYSAQESRQLGGDVFNISIDAKNVKEFNDIVEMAKSARMRRRMG